MVAISKKHQKRLVFLLHLALFRLVDLSKRKIIELCWCTPHGKNIALGVCVYKSYELSKSLVDTCSSSLAYHVMSRQQRCSESISVQTAKSETKTTKKTHRVPFFYSVPPARVIRNTIFAAGERDNFACLLETVCVSLPLQSAPYRNINYTTPLVHRTTRDSTVAIILYVCCSRYNINTTTRHDKTLFRM